MKAVNFKNGMYVIVWMVLVQSTKAQIYNISNLSFILSQSKSDSVMHIERLAAFKSQKIINEYRVKNRQDTISWDEGLWLTCRNHNVWMSTNSELSHSEWPNTKFFLGISPNDRYDFTTSKKGTCSWSAENALYNLSFKGTTIIEIAEEIASTSFKQWRQSPGHNKNMLGENHKSHGVSFYIGQNEVVWATDLFSFNIDEKFNTNKISKVTTLIDKQVVVKISKKKQTFPPIEKKVKINLKKVEAKLLNKLYDLTDEKQLVVIKKNKAMEKAAHSHSLYMSYSKK